MRYPFYCRCETFCCQVHLLMAQEYSCSHKMSLLVTIAATSPPLASYPCHVRWLLYQQIIQQHLLTCRFLLSYLCRTDPADVARVEGKTFIVTPERHSSVPHVRPGVQGILGRWMSPEDADWATSERFPGCMAGEWSDVRATMVQTFHMANVSPLSIYFSQARTSLTLGIESTWQLLMARYFIGTTASATIMFIYICGYLIDSHLGCSNLMFTNM